MRILQINNYHYVHGGSDRVYLDTSRLLREKGHEVVNFSIDEDKASAEGNNEYFVKAPAKDSTFAGQIQAAWRFVYSRTAARRLQELIDSEKPDIAHLHIFYGRLTSSILPVLKNNNIPCVMTVHEYRMLCPIYVLMDRKMELCEKCAHGNYLFCVLKQCNRGSYVYSMLSALECFIRDTFFSYDRYIDKFIMVSRFIEAKHLEYKSGMKGRVTHLYNYCEQSNTVEQSTADSGYYLYFGRLSREKGLLTLLKAWKKLPSRRLVIAGDGALREELQAYVKNENMHNVSVIGYVSGESLIRTIVNARFIVVPSEWYENNPLSIIESLAHSKPVIAARIGGIPEIVENGKTGFLFEAGSVESLVASVATADAVTDDEYLNMSTAALLFASEHFHKEKYYTALIDIYSEVLCSSGNTGGSQGSRSSPDRAFTMPRSS